MPTRYRLAAVLAETKRHTLLRCKLLLARIQMLFLVGCLKYVKKVGRARIYLILTL
jgi:hypothetical protein